MEYSKDSTPFFAVSTAKFIVMSVFTFGIYELYWFYWNWKRIRDRESSDISPFWRTVFAYFYCYQCFARVNGYATTKGIAASVPAGLLAGGWIVAQLLWNVPGPLRVIGMFAFVPMLPVVTLTNEINQAIAPGHDPNSRFSFWNVLLIVTVVVIMFALFVLQRGPMGVKQIALAAWTS